MSWGLILLAAFLLSCLLALPAAAGIKRFTDSQGVIRITNTDAATPRQIIAEPPAALEIPQEFTSEPKARGLPEPAPMRAAVMEPIAGKRVSPPDVPAISLPAMWPEPQLALRLPSAPENRETAASPENPTVPGPLPVQKVAYDQDWAGAALLWAPQPASLPQPEPGAPGGIRHVRDRQGVLVITNVAPASKEAAPRLLQAEYRSGPGRDFSETQFDLPVAVPGAPNLRPVSWNPDQPLAASLPAAARSARSTVSAGDGTIHRYRDKDGVIHIENVGTTTTEPLSPKALLARTQPAGGKGPLVPPRSSPQEEAGPKVVVKPGAWSGEKEAKPSTVLTAAASRQEEVSTPGGIRRYRDRLGIWRIETVDDHWILEAPPLPPNLGASTQEVLLAAAQAVTRLPEAARAAGGVQPGPAAVNDHGGIMAVRDSRGRLTITDASPQAGMGKGPSWALASAQLDPIIQEAARAYGLPPTLIRAVIRAESNFVNAAVSPKGAMGLMQLMPGTAADLGVQEPFNPRENIHGGCRYLRLLINSFGGSLPLALAAYNAGYQRVVNSGYRVPAIKETQDFLTQVIGWYLTEEKKAQRPWT